MTDANVAFLVYMTTAIKTDRRYNDGRAYEINLERVRKDATADLLDGHIRLQSGRYVQPEVCGPDCIRCRLEKR